MSQKITPEARHRRHRESLQEQLVRNKEAISELLDQRRKLDWALRITDECEANNILIGDQGDINFHLSNDE